MEGILVKPSEATVNTATSRDEGRPIEIQQNPKRTRSYVLKQMLEECRRVKKESMDAIEEIEAALVKPEPLSEEEEQGELGKDVLDHAKIPEGSKGKQQKSGNVVLNGKKSYHAAVYMASFHASSSQRNGRNAGSGNQKGIAVADSMSDDAEKFWVQGKRKARMPGTVALGELSSQQKKDHISTNAVRNSGARRMSERVKGKSQVVGNSVEKSAKLQEDKANAEVSRRGVNRAKYRRSSTPAPVSVKEVNWTRIVDNPEKLRKNALFIPRAVIRECIYGKIPRITLIDRINDVPYYCEMIKREGTVDRYLCGMWSDFCKDHNLQKGDTMRFCIRHPPVESTLVSVERG